MTSKWKNVFVLNVGRSGSNTFAKACSHVTNYTSGHETRSWEIGASRFDYPTNHIEADNKLSWMLGAIDSQYGNEAFYVHLKRNKAEVVKSWNERWNYSFSNIRAFTEGVLSNVPELLTDAEKQIIGEMHYDVVNANIELFLRDKSNILTVRLEEIESDFPRFWEAIGAEGDFNAAMAEFKVKHNHTESKDVVEKKERSFRMDIQQKILLKQLREGGTLAQTISWRMQLFILKVKLLTA